MVCPEEPPRLGHAEACHLGLVVSTNLHVWHDTPRALPMLAVQLSCLHLCVKWLLPGFDGVADPSLPVPLMMAYGARVSAEPPAASQTGETHTVHADDAALAEQHLREWFACDGAKHPLSVETRWAMFDSLAASTAYSVASSAGFDVVESAESAESATAPRDKSQSVGAVDVLSSDCQQDMLPPSRALAVLTALGLGPELQGVGWAELGLSAPLACRSTLQTVSELQAPSREGTDNAGRVELIKSLRMARQHCLALLRCFVLSPEAASRLSSSGGSQQLLALLHTKLRDPVRPLASAPPAEWSLWTDVALTIGLAAGNQTQHAGGAACGAPEACRALAVPFAADVAVSLVSTLQRVTHVLHDVQDACMLQMFPTALGLLLAQLLNQQANRYNVVEWTLGPGDDGLGDSDPNQGGVTLHVGVGLKMLHTVTPDAACISSLLDSSSLMPTGRTPSSCEWRGAARLAALRCIVGCRLVGMLLRCAAHHGRRFGAAECVPALERWLAWLGARGVTTNGIWASDTTVGGVLVSTVVLATISQVVQVAAANVSALASSPLLRGAWASGDVPEYLAAMLSAVPHSAATVRLSSRQCLTRRHSAITVRVWQHKLTLGYLSHFGWLFPVRARVVVSVRSSCALPLPAP